MRTAFVLAGEDPGQLSYSEIELLRGADSRTPEPRELSDLRELILDGGDPLGDAFSSLRSPLERRHDGATYTPRAVVETMVNWAEEQGTPARVVDPGSGSARFAVAAGLRFPTAQIVAVELDPVAALITRANLAVHGLDRRSTVLVQDYRTVRQKRIDGTTLYIGNPPYVRHHQIDPRWKDWLAATAADRGLRASRLAGLHVHFFLATAAQAHRGDYGAFITSAEWLDVNYGALVRDLVLDGLGGRAIHVVAPEVQPFDDAQTTAAITCFTIGSTPTSLKLRTVRKLRELKTLDGGQLVRRERLAEARRWTPLLRAARPVPDGHIELGELCRVHRGAVTGANRVWVVDPTTVRLPEQVIFRSVTKARELLAAGVALGRETPLRAVVDLPADLDELEGADRRAVERFIRTAKRLGAHESYIARHRRVWWSIGLRNPAPILATYMARRAPAIVRNLAEARHINVAHGLYPREPLSPRLLDKLAAAVRESIHVGHGRTYAGGLTKFEPKEMERLLIPNVVDG